MNKAKPSFWVTVFNLAIVCLLLLLPYYLFNGRLFLGGDDTRLYYAYPNEVLTNFALFSWNNISSLPSYIPNHHSIPFLAFFSLLDLIINSKVSLFYLAFSLPLVLGFVYFQKFVRELIGREYLISIVLALVYVLSPITIVSLSYFLTPVWLIALFPILSYYYLSFIHRGEIGDVFKATGWSIFLSIAFYTIPWILGLLIPLFCGFIFLFLFVDNPIKKKVKNTIVFGLFIIISQLFWVTSFFASLIIGGSTGLGEKIVSKDLTGSFIPTVLATAKGNIIYPLLTFYHRQLAIDYDLHLRSTFTGYFDHVLPVSIIFIIVLFLGLINYKSILGKAKEKIFIFFFVSFIAALYFFTVNIGFLKDIFLFLGYLPGFAVFRNFTDKFLIGYIFVYASFLSLCFYVIKKSVRIYKLLLFITIIAVGINFVPIKQVINSPLVTTKNIQTSVILPEEYLLFINEVKSVIPSTENVIDFPQTITSYAAIMEDNGKNAYIGTSPFRFLTGVNDLGGDTSYPPQISVNIRKSIMKKEYKQLLSTLQQINVGYVMVTNNIPAELLGSYIYNKEYLKFQDKNLIKAIADYEVIRSEKGNYVLYKLKNSSTVFSSKAKIDFEKINSTKYKIQVSDLKSSEKLFFKETYHPGWKLYLSKESSGNDIFSYLSEMFYLFKKPVFEASHHKLLPYGNEWTINFEALKKSDKATYQQNKDGSISVELTLYFLPQLYLYFGVAATILGLLFGTIYIFKINKNEIN